MHGTHTMNHTKQTLSPLSFSQALVYLKILLPVFLILFSSSQAQARDGLYLKLSLGPGSGVAREMSTIQDSGYALGTKNHAVGWARDNKFSVSLTEFGSLLKLNVNEYGYINLDLPYALGLTYYSPWDFNLFISAGPSKVYFAHEWSDPFGDLKGKGYGINASAEKEWMISKRVGLGAGAQIYYIQTNQSKYKFLNFSVNILATFYWRPVQ